MQLKLSTISSTMLTAVTLLLAGCGGGDSSPSNTTVQQVNLADAMGFYESSLKIDLSKTRSISIGASAKPSAQVKTLDGTRFSMETSDQSHHATVQFLLDGDSQNSKHQLTIQFEKSTKKIFNVRYEYEGKFYYCASSEDQLIDNKENNCNNQISIKTNIESNNPITITFKNAIFYQNGEFQNYEMNGDVLIKLNGEIKGLTTNKIFSFGNTNPSNSSILFGGQRSEIQGITWSQWLGNFHYPSQAFIDQKIGIKAITKQGQDIEFYLYKENLKPDMYIIPSTGAAIGYIEETRKIKIEANNNLMKISFENLKKPSAQNEDELLTGNIKYRIPTSTLRHQSRTFNLYDRISRVYHTTFNSILNKHFYSLDSFGEVSVSILNKQVIAVTYTYRDDSGYHTTSCTLQSEPCQRVSVSEDLTTVTFNNTKIGSFNFNGELFSELF